jgi:2-iminobutanoate/2-iminopropanoate deaminase
VIEAPIEHQIELVLEQMKLCLETAGSSLENVLKCNVYCTSVDKFAAVNAIYALLSQGSACADLGMRSRVAGTV